MGSSFWPKLILLLAALSCAATAGVRADTSVDNAPTVVVRLDDCGIDWTLPQDALDGKSPLQYAKDRKIPITFGIVVDWCDKGYSIPWDEIGSYLDYAGGEPASHSYYHGNTSSQIAAILELLSSRNTIEDRLPGYQCTTFIQPGGWMGDDYLSDYSQLDSPLGIALGNIYQQSMAYIVDGVVVGNVYYRECMGFQFHFDSRWIAWTPEAVSATLDVIAHSPGSMQIFEVHHVGLDPTSSISVDAASYKTFIDRLADMRASGAIEVASFADACNRSVSQGINHLPDPGFEASALGPLNPEGPWYRSGSTGIMSSGGVGGSRYAVIPGPDGALSPRDTVLAPGQYELSWYQRPEAQNPHSQGLGVTATLDGDSPTLSLLCNQFYLNTDPSAWEQKRVVFVVPERMPTFNVTFQPAAAEEYGLDNVSLTSIPADPAAPANPQVNPGFGNCSVSWDTPNDPNLSAISIRYSSGSWPMGINDGQVLATVSSAAGTHQQVSAPIDWTSAAGQTMFFSVFAVRQDGTASRPALAYTQVDARPNAPSVSLVSRGWRTASVKWKSGNGPAPYLYRYSVSVGSFAGGTAMVDASVSTQTTQATLANLPGSQLLHVMVQAANRFGVLSDPGTVSFSAGGVSAALQSNGRLVPVTVSGCVTAIFGDCYYVEEADKSRGIKITGDAPPGVVEGQELTVSGILITRNGERTIMPHY